MLPMCCYCQVEEVLGAAKKHQPAVLQNESHPYLHERDLRTFCSINNIAFQVGRYNIFILLSQSFTYFTY